MRHGPAVRRWLAAALLLPLLATPARADDIRGRRDRLKRAVAASQDNLGEATAAVHRAAAALAAVAIELPRARTRLAAAEGRLAAAEAAARASAGRLVAAHADVGAADAAYATSAASLAAARRRLGAVARAIYMRGPSAYVGTILGIGSPADLATGLAASRALFRSAAARVADTTAARADLAGRAGQLELRRAEVAARDQAARDALARVRDLTDAAREAQAAVVAQVTARRTALAVAARERAADLRRYRALVAESERLARLIRRGSSGTGKVGDLLWPTAGPVTSGFGWRIHPIYHYRRFHPGIDIGAPLGQPIHAALAGVVVSAGPMGTYGNIVVIDHGNGFATAYAHQSRILVSAGQRVGRGETIGLVGSTGASTGPHLHFETRVNGVAVDPMRYF